MTLTQAATWTKRGIALFAITFVLGTVAIIGYNVWYRYYLSTLPKPEAKPEMKFGALPEIKFPPSSISPTNFSYSVDTQTGELPKFPKLMKVYFIPPVALSLLAPDKTVQLAQSLGFSQGPEPLPSNQQKFTDDQGNQLLVDLATGNFHFQKPVATPSATLNETSFDKDRFVTDFRNYLGSRNLLADSLQKGRAEVYFNTASASASPSAQLSLWPESVDELPVVTAPLSAGLIRAKAAASQDETISYSQVNYTLWQIDTTTSGTYPLKTAEQALNELKSGRGFIDRAPDNPKISIDKVSLAYFETDEYAPYLQPVFLFEGPNFAALIPAVGK